MCCFPYWGLVQGRWRRGDGAWIGASGGERDENTITEICSGSDYQCELIQEFASYNSSLYIRAGAT